jgi:hypothetical protein
VAVAVTLLGACTSDARGAQDEVGSSSTTSVQEPERIEISVVPIPPSVTDPRFPWYLPEGERLLFTGTPAGGSRGELMAIRPDGRDVACLTCGVDPGSPDAILKPFPFPDGRRALVRIGQQTVVRAARHAVVECTPSLADCANAVIVPISVPGDAGVEVQQDQREMRIAPDGRHVGLTQILGGPDGEPTFAAIVGVLGRTDGGYEIREARVVSTRGELKGFTPDGAAVLVAAFTTNPDAAANPDVLRVDLATGEEERLTADPDYDEPLELSPDGRAYVVGSGRTTGLFETVSQLRRPNLIGPGLEPLAAALFLEHQPQLIEPWLVETGAETDGRQGVRLNPASAAEGFEGRAIPAWRPDGTGIVFWEAAVDGGASRLVVASLPDREAVERPRVAVPEARWAPRLAGFVPPEPITIESRDGRIAGRVDVRVQVVPGDPRATRIEIRYHGFADEEGWVIDGVERATFLGGLTGSTTYYADLTLSGDHAGWLRADAAISPSGIDGPIESNVDGRRLQLP